MAKDRFRKRWSQGTVSALRGRALSYQLANEFAGVYIPYSAGRPFSFRNRQPQTRETIIRQTQVRSVRSRESKGIKPSMPTFSFDKPALTRLDRCKAAAHKALPNAMIVSVSPEHAGHIIMSMRSKAGQHTVCVQVATAHVVWMA